jgi:hypothetical protein
MALIKCPECAQQISDAALSCPHCGRPKALPSTAKSIATTDGIGTGAGCVIGVVVGVLLLIILANLPGGNSSPSASSLESTYGSSEGALSVCEDFVKDRLKAPSTAKFGIEGTVQSAVIVLDSGRFVVRGYYDAENSFSAMLRSHYTCKVKHTSGRSYSLQDLELYK